MPAVPDDDVIQQTDTEQLAGFFQSGCQFNVFPAGRWIPAGMIVYQQQRRRRGEQN